jgi:hypothetical protein
MNNTQLSPTKVRIDQLSPKSSSSTIPTPTTQTLLTSINIVYRLVVNNKVKYLKVVDDLGYYYFIENEDKPNSMDIVLNESEVIFNINNDLKMKLRKLAYGFSKDMLGYMIESNIGYTVLYCEKGIDFKQITYTYVDVNTKQQDLVIYPLAKAKSEDIGPLYKLLRKLEFDMYSIKTKQVGLALNNLSDNISKFNELKDKLHTGIEQTIRQLEDCYHIYSNDEEKINEIKYNLRKRHEFYINLIRDCQVINSDLEYINILTREINNINNRLKELNLIIEFVLKE